MDAPTVMYNPQDPQAFNPWIQVVSLRQKDGSTFNVTMIDFNWFRTYGVRNALSFGMQAGATALVLLVMLALTKKEKAKTHIFFLNSICLLLNFARVVLQAMHFLSEYWHPYSLASGDYSRVRPSVTATSVATNVMTLMLVICLFISLTFQVRVVLCTTPKKQRYLILCATSFVALVAIALRLTVTVLNSIFIVRAQYFLKYNTLVNVQSIAQAVAIWFFSIIFCIKLWVAIRQRKKLGMNQFGALQCIFIIGLQCMTLPAIFAVLQFIPDSPELGQWSLTFVAILLPLSAIWAGIVVDAENLAARGYDSHHRLIGQYGPSKGGSGNHPTSPRSQHGLTTKRSADNTSSTTSTGDYKETKEPLTPATASPSSPTRHHGPEELTNPLRVHVDHAFPVENKDASDRV